MRDIILFSRNDKLASNCYVLKSEDEYCVIDPSVSIDTVMSELKLSQPPKYVLLTHEHIDHCWELNSYISCGVKILCSEKCGINLKNPKINCSIWVNGSYLTFDFIYHTLKDNDDILIGSEIVKVIESQGHSEGGLSFVGKDYCFTGDTLFAGGSIGRYDLPGSDLYMLRQSLEKLFGLQPDMIIYPGHGDKTTLKDTKSLLRI